MDNEIEFGLPCYSNPFWSPTSNRTFFGEEYHSDNINFAGDALPFQHNHIHTQTKASVSGFPSVNHEGSFDCQSANLADYQLEFLHSCNDLDVILGFSDAPRQNEKLLTQMWPASDDTYAQSSFEGSSYSRSSQGSFSIPNPVPPTVNQHSGSSHKTYQCSPSMKPGRRLSRDGVKNDSQLHGLITPEELTPKRSPPPSATKRQNPTSPPHDDNQKTPKEPPKVKRRRRAGRQQITKQQEKSNRKLFLERNRSAAARSRQKKKAWIDDIMAKVNVLKENYKSQKSQRDDLEQEIQQLRSMLFLHSRLCNNNDIGLWIEEESKRVNDDAISLVQQ